MVSKLQTCRINITGKQTGQREEDFEVIHASNFLICKDMNNEINK
jgi:hypothetical protein